MRLITNPLCNHPERRRLSAGLALRVRCSDNAEMAETATVYSPDSMRAEKRGVAGSSVFAAVVITALKVVVGLATGSLGILSEAAHSGLDLVAAVVTFLSVRVSEQGHRQRHFGSLRPDRNERARLAPARLPRESPLERRRAVRRLEWYVPGLARSQ